MIKIALCDDEQALLDALSGYIKNYFLRKNIEMELAQFTNAKSFLAAFDAGVYNIVILDILMPDQTGIDLAKIIFGKDKNCLIAFLTSSPDFAIQGYGVNAVSYLLKPTTQEKVDALLNQCLERQSRTPSRSFFVKTGHLQKKVEIEQTIYLESRNKWVYIYCDDETIVASGKLSDLLAKLPPSFIQVHKSYAVNLERIKAMSRNSMISDTDITIPISRQFQKEAAKSYFTYVAKQI